MPLAIEIYTIMYGLHACDVLNRCRNIQYDGIVITPCRRLGFIRDVLQTKSLALQKLQRFRHSKQFLISVGAAIFFLFLKKTLKRFCMLYKTMMSLGSSTYDNTTKLAIQST